MRIPYTVLARTSTSQTTVKIITSLNCRAMSLGGGYKKMNSALKIVGLDMNIKNLLVS